MFYTEDEHWLSSFFNPKFPFKYVLSDEERKAFDINLAGTEKEDISLNREGKKLIVSVKGEDKYVVACQFVFDDVEAEYKNGLLKIKFTKDKSPPTEIKIK